MAHDHVPTVDRWVASDDDLREHLERGHEMVGDDTLPRAALEGMHREAHDRGWFRV